MLNPSQFQLSVIFYCMGLRVWCGPIACVALLKGTGLGMEICGLLVNKIGPEQEICILSKQNEGTTV